MKRRIVPFLAAAVLLVFLSAAGSAQNSKVIEIALCNDNAPFEFADASGVIRGFDYEVLKKINELLPEYSFHFQLIDESAEAVGLQTGKYQLGAGNHFYTAARDKTFFLTKAYDYNVIVLAVRTNSTIKTLADLNGKTVQPIPSLDGMYTVLHGFLDKNPGIKIYSENSTAGNPADDLKGVVDGRYDAVFWPEVIIDAAQKGLNLPLKKTGVLDAVGNYFLINRQQPEFRDKVNASIDKLISSGWLQDLAKKYFGYDVFKEYADKHPKYDTK
ncbi:MAG: transporter substrate-binding domain-containing protein [Brevinematales bacterium]|jgi:L-cystine transport system substrate-binding protein